MAFACPQVALLNLPKAQSAADVRQAVAALESAERRNGVARPIGLLVNIETARALRLAPEIAAAHPRVAGLQLGLADLFESMQADRRDPANVHAAMFQMSMACAESGKFAYDSAYPDVADEAGFRREAEQARKLGYVGKSCIHPQQVALANETFGAATLDRGYGATHRRGREGCRGGWPRRFPARRPDDRPAVRQARPGRAGRRGRQQRSPVRAILALAALTLSATAAAESISSVDVTSLPALNGASTPARVIAIDDRPVVLQPGVVHVLDAGRQGWNEVRRPDGLSDAPTGIVTAGRQTFVLEGAQVAQLKLNGDVLTLHALPGMPAALTSAVGVFADDTLYVAGLDASGAPHLLQLALASEVGQWGPLAAWPGGGAPTSIVFRLGSLYLTVRSEGDPRRSAVALVATEGLAGSRRRARRCRPGLGARDRPGTHSLSAARRRPARRAWRRSIRSRAPGPSCRIARADRSTVSRQSATVS